MMINYNKIRGSFFKKLRIKIKFESIFHFIFKNSTIAEAFNTSLLMNEFLLLLQFDMHTVCLMRSNSDELKEKI